MAQRKSAAKQQPRKISRKVKAGELVELTIVSRSTFKPQKKFLNDWVNRIALELQAQSAAHPKLKNLKWSGAELTIAFLDTKQAKELNKMYRGRDYATDVLSFSDDAEGNLGELAICPDVVKKQAKDHGLSFDEELGYMILHGMLHLLGFDHETSKRDEKLMFKLQDTVFDALTS